MLRTALEFLETELNSYIQKRDPVNFGNTNLATLSSIVNQEGKFEFDNSDVSNEHQIIISLVNISEDRFSECQNYIQKTEQGTIRKVNPAVNLEFFLLFCAYSDDYKSCLRNLTFVITFFQSQTVFSADKYPHLNNFASPDKPWQKVEKLIFSFYNLNFEHQNNLWAAMGAKYMPSVLYKMRILRFSEEEYQHESPPIVEANLISGD